MKPPDPFKPSDVWRRRLLAAAALTVPAVVGLLSYAKFQRDSASGDADAGTNNTNNGAANNQRAVAQFFETSLNDVDGKAQALSQWRGRLLVVNFWATWCAPCVEEMPDLQALREAYLPRGVEVLGLAIDNPKSVVEFRNRLGVQYPLLVAGMSGTEMLRAFGSESGGLPHTIIIDRTGMVRASKAGRLRINEFKSSLDKVLAAT